MWRMVRVPPQGDRSWGEGLCTGGDTPSHNTKGPGSAFLLSGRTPWRLRGVVSSRAWGDSTEAHMLWPGLAIGVGRGSVLPCLK